MTYIIEKQDYEQAIADFVKKHHKPVLDDIKANNKAIDNLKLKSRDRTYDMVAALLDLARETRPDAPTPGYEAFLISRGLKKAAEGRNPYKPFVDAVFAEQTNGKWIVNRSYEKYANIIRFLVDEEASSGFNGQTVQDFIRAFPEMLRGIEAKDRENHPNAALSEANENKRQLGRQAAAKATVNETFNGNEGELMIVYGRVSRGRLELLHAETASADKAESVYLAIGRTFNKKK